MYGTLGVETDRFAKNPTEWNEDRHYCEAKEFVRQAKVVNDSCERSVKMIQDYCNVLTKDSEIRRGLLKAVDSSREYFPNFSKETLNKGIK